VGRTPFRRDGEGRLFTTRLWFHGPKGHLSYLANFTMASPVIGEALPKRSVPLESEASPLGTGNVPPELHILGGSELATQYESVRGVTTIGMLDTRHRLLAGMLAGL
jgi:hypothetical protein